MSNLQGTITSKYKDWTSDKVLKTAQSLYEKKAITYPRTASQVLDESLIEKTEKVLNAHKQGNPFASEIIFHTAKRIFDSKKVESHSMIIPTYMISGNLTNDEKIVYDEIKNRFLAQFMPVAESEETILRITFDDLLKGLFISKGKVQLTEGWKKIEKVTTKEVNLPMIEEKEQLVVKNGKVTEIMKGKAPKAHNEKPCCGYGDCGKVMKKKILKK